MTAAFFSPGCIFNPFVLKNFYTAVTNSIKTDFSLEDTRLAYELLKTYQTVTVENIVLSNANYLYQPNPDEYGGAYVLRPEDENFKEIHQVISEKLQVL